MKKLLLQTSLALASLLLLAGAAMAIEKGTPAPDFELPNIEGKKIHLSDYKGQVILLKLATTWCPTCKQQAGEIVEASQRFEGKDVAVIEVFLQDSEEMVKEALEGQDYGVPFQALMDDGQARKAYNVYLIPRMLIIDRDFNIQRDGSLISAYDLRKKVERLLGETETQVQ